MLSAVLELFSGMRFVYDPTLFYYGDFMDLIADLHWPLLYSNFPVDFYANLAVIDSLTGTILYLFFFGNELIPSHSGFAIFYHWA